jgi:hypothetical protein
MSRGLGWGHVIGVTILGGIYALISFAPLWHTDVWGHVQYGRWIIEHRVPPEREPFTPYADQGQKLPQTQWLSQVIYAAVFQAGEQLAGMDGDPARALAGGVESLLALHVLVMTGFYVFFWLACQRIGGSVVWANLALLLLLPGMLSAMRYHRPQMFGMFCFAILLFVTSRRLTSRAAVIGLTVLLVLWANLHGSFVVGLAFLGLFTLNRLVGAISNRDVERPSEVVSRSFWRNPQLFRPALATLLSVAAIALLNPHGLALFQEILTFADRPNVRLLDEWRPIELRPGTPGFWPYVIASGLVIVAWIASGFSRTPLLIVVLPFALLPLLQQRAMTWWLPLAVWYIAAAGPAIGQRFGIARWIPAGRLGLAQALLVCMIALVALAFFGLVQWLLRGEPRFPGRTLTGATCWQLGLELRAGPELRGRWLPAFAEAIRSYPDGRFTGAIYASETMGDYLLTVVREGSPVLLYSHAHVFSPEYFQQAMAVKNAEGDWQAWLKVRRVNLVTIEADLYPRLAAGLRQDPEWAIIIDEAKTAGSRGPGQRKFIALRKHPL